ncbi:MAG: ABC transporter permease, partial [Hyphomicrobiaceae bacterium]
MRRVTEILLVFAGAVAAWQLLVWLTGVPPFILPGPGRVALSLADNASLIAGHAGVTILEVLAGLVIGAT